jgi:hypothetical protein
MENTATMKKQRVSLKTAAAHGATIRHLLIQRQGHAGEQKNGFSEKLVTLGNNPVYAMKGTA